MRRRVTLRLERYSGILFGRRRKVKMGEAAKGFKSRMEHYIYSGEKKHVFGGIVIISAIFAVPWFLMNRGSKHQSHQDYLEKADKARSARLSSAPSSPK